MYKINKLLNQKIIITTQNFNYYKKLRGYRCHVNRTILKHNARYK